MPILGADREADTVANLRAQHEAMRKEKRKITMQIKNEKRKRSRLLKKSNSLSNHELLKVLQQRGARAAAAQVSALEETAAITPASAERAEAAASERGATE